MIHKRFRDGVVRRGERRWSYPLSGRVMVELVVCVAACGLVGALGCAPKQRVPLDVTPTATSIYLDGEPLEGMPRELKLRSDQDHKLFFKSEGHRSELVVLRSSLHEGKPRLEPAGVRLRLIPLDPTRRQLVIESGGEAPDPDVAAGSSAASGAPAGSDD